MTAVLLPSCTTGTDQGQRIDSGIKSQLKIRETLPFLGNLTVHRFVFVNDLKLLVVENPSSPTFAYQIWYDVGSKNEVHGKTGLAHFFEHLMFKRTKNLEAGEFDRILEKAGVDGANAYTSHDATVYVQKLPKRKDGENLELIAKLEADRMTNLIVDEAAFNTEREVVHNERKLTEENNPEGQMSQALFETMFKRHPYRWPIIGYEADLSNMTSSDAKRFYRKHYLPKNATIVVVGDVKANKVAHLISKYYMDLNHNQTSEKSSDDTGEKIQNDFEPDQKGPRRKRLLLNIQVEKILLGFRVNEFSHQDTPVLEVIQSLLTTGRSARLNRALIETGISNSVSSGNYLLKHPGVFVIESTLQQSKRSASALAVILRELKTLSQIPITLDEIERAKNLILFNFYKQMSTHDDLANFLGSHETTNGHFLEGTKLYEKIRLVSPGDIERVAKETFTAQKRTIILGSKK